MPDRVLSIIQARTGSTRLPSKVLLDLAGKPVLQHVIERIARSALTTQFIVATTINPADLAIVRLCADLGVSVYCGSEDDPLERYYQAAHLFCGSHIVRIKADCPLIDPEIVDRAIRLHLSSGADYTGNTLQRTYPVGQDVEIMTAATLTRLWKCAGLFSEREHITLYIPKHPEMFRIEHLRQQRDHSAKRWTMDMPEDYELLRAIFQNLHPKNPFFGMSDVIDFLSKNPGLERINAHIPVDAGVRKSLSSDHVVALPT
ncbi:MAG: glycosyltransferase family protein [Desulfobacteraceae bacterium]|nr:glycosyltransferase family protein [Desulfobacteraceae bacterium]